MASCCFQGKCSLCTAHNRDIIISLPADAEVKEIPARCSDQTQPWMQKEWIASLAAGSSYYFAEALECVGLDDDGEIEDTDVTLPF